MLNETERKLTILPAGEGSGGFSVLLAPDRQRVAVKVFETAAEILVADWNASSLVDVPDRMAIRVHPRTPLPSLSSQATGLAGRCLGALQEMSEFFPAAQLFLNTVVAANTLSARGRLPLEVLARDIPAVSAADDYMAVMAQSQAEAGLSVGERLVVKPLFILPQIEPWQKSLFLVDFEFALPERPRLSPPLILTEAGMKGQNEELAGLVQIMQVYARHLRESEQPGYRNFNGGDERVCLTTIDLPQEYESSLKTLFRPLLADPDLGPLGKPAQTLCALTILQRGIAVGGDLARQWMIY